mmetsp:Transcript_134716/g.430394  ORF Transcript_134716/g.430394 Transcript_134716/m.430394 type:complete len:98 (+) Transcript_134716:334-627(+)
MYKAKLHSLQKEGHPLRRGLTTQQPESSSISAACIHAIFKLPPHASNHRKRDLLSRTFTANSCIAASLGRGLRHHLVDALSRFVMNSTDLPPPSTTL